MYESFLKTQKTIPHRIRDFTEWHNGVSQYGFWAIVIDDSRWVEMFDAACSHLKQFIHPGYQREPHITIMACGLVDQKYFSTRQLERQVVSLAEAMIAPFYLTAESLDSFASAPYITVEDPTGTLNRIRTYLAAISEEDNPAEYQPHITLGLYRDAFDTFQVADRLKEFAYAPISPLRVSELAFCVYETKDIQGPFRIRDRVTLNDGSGNGVRS